MNALIEKLPKKNAKIVKGSFIHVLLEKEAKSEAKGKAEGKKEMLASLIAELPHLDDATLAKAAKVDESYVRDLRRALEMKS